MSDKEVQKDELMALESIYTKEEFQVIKKKNQLGGKFFASVKLTQDFKVTFTNLHKKDSDAQTITVQFLPPICLNFTLPEDYPSLSRPDYWLSCSWLTGSQLQQLSKKLNATWNEHKGMEILYLWMQFLVEESLSLINIQDTLDISKLETQHLKLKELEHQRELESQRVMSTQMQQQRNKREPVMHSDDQGRSDGRYQPKSRHRTEKSMLQNFKERKCSEKDHSLQTESLLLETKAGTRNECDNRQRGQTRWLRERIFHPKQRTSSGYKQRGYIKKVKYSVMQLIKDFDAAQGHMAFLRNSHSCKICFEDKVGSDCFMFKDCGHVFCKKCITHYFTLRIKDGTVHTILCPGDKCKCQATPLQIQELVGPELYARYDSILLNSLLDTLEDTYYCPRQFCQYPVGVEEGEKMGICPSCNYVFCVYCKRVYHGVEPCRFKDNEKKKLVEEYTTCDESRRKFLEQRYGKQQLQTLVDSSLSEKWLSSNSKNCPNCKAAIEKLDGCNKMVCWKCNTSFCWLCERSLNPQAPYLHFNDPTSKCFNLLFHGVVETEQDELDDGWDEWLNEPEFSESEEETFSDDDGDK